MILDSTEKHDRRERAKEHREKRQEISLIRSIPYSDHQRYHNPEYADERHRHRYEVNPEVVEHLEKTGLRFVGKDESGQRMEVLELPSHPFQFHPEYKYKYKSRPGKPSTLFLGMQSLVMFYL
ncbi:hypothetical protein L6452_26335 [Arctium lappa]|uniref:Uncharacterized protein n=1 Tax=Arctium lappa TaxID=4217 RepID=A0ACB9ACH7_ARCLA|nr:hypothetical protein L6452_26335 [Arctium lappa]